MNDRVRVAFERQLVSLPVSALLPLRVVSDDVKKTVKYRRIARSIAEVGVIEPLVVARSKEDAAQYLLLDGHMRLAALIDMRRAETRCLVSDDDEAFTYNKRVNRLATVQQHFMFERAIERGVPVEKLAKALNLDVAYVKRRRGILKHICAEAVEILKDKVVNPVAFQALRKMKPMRQIEAAELMTAAGNYTGTYAQALLAATRQKDLLLADKPKKVGGLSTEQMARMEREMSSLQQDIRSIENSYGEDVLRLVVASGYLARLIRNSEIERYLRKHHPELLTEFRTIVSVTSLEAASEGAGNRNPRDGRSSSDRFQAQP